MMIFGENPERVIDGFSEVRPPSPPLPGPETEETRPQSARGQALTHRGGKRHLRVRRAQEFEADFMEHWRRAHPSSRIAANVLYNEFIADRHHIHMNATKWLTLTEFVKYLGREGKARVEETPKGWFMTLVRRDPDAERREGERAKRRRVEEMDAMRAERHVRQQIERAGGGAGGSGGEGVRELERGAPGDKGATISLKLGAGAARAGAGALALAPPKLGVGKSLLSSGGGEGRARSKAEEGAAGGGGLAGAAGLESRKQNPDALLEIRRREEQERDRKYRTSRWVCRGIVVKVLAKDLREAGYYKEKARVQGVEEHAGRFVCELEVLRDGAVVRTDQAHLETVLPRPGGLVRVVNGGYRGEEAELVRVDAERFQALVRITQGTYMNREVWLDYEDVSKAAAGGAK